MSGKDVNDFEYIVVFLGVVNNLFQLKIFNLWTLSIVLVLFDTIILIILIFNIMGVHLTIIKLS